MVTSAAPPLQITDGPSLAVSLALYLTAASIDVLDPAGEDLLIYPGENVLMYHPGRITSTSVQACAPGPMVHIGNATTAVCDAFNRNFTSASAEAIFAYLPAYSAHSCNMGITVSDSCSTCTFLSAPIPCPMEPSPPPSPQPPSPPAVPPPSPSPPAPPSPPCQLCVTLTVLDDGHPSALSPPSPDATSALDLARYLTTASTAILNPTGADILTYSPGLATNTSVRVCTAASDLPHRVDAAAVTTRVCTAFNNAWAFPMLDPGVITAHLPRYEAYFCNMQIAVQDSCSACSYTSILTACPHAT